MKMVPLGDVAEFASGGTPDRKNESFYQGEIPWITGADIDDEGHVRTRHHITEQAVQKSATKITRKNSLLLVTRTSVGKTLIPPHPVSFSQDLTAINPCDNLDLKYLSRFLQSRSQYFEQHSRGATIKGVTRQVVENLRIPLPPLDEQRRIAAILDKADAIRQKRRQATTHLDTLTQSIFYRMFLTHQEWETCPLGTIADVDSGITKGRKAKDVTLSQTPYLAVSNVQDGYLDLTNVKHIAATAAEIKRFKLLPGDLLLTEGGDPDKLGRGSVWNGEIAGCIHQNHIFRVRLNQTSPVTSFFFSQYLRTHEAKQYFLKSAKQTTGIASINKTQLSKFPVPLVPKEDQTRFAKYSLAISRRRDTSMKSLSTAESLFASLQSRAFRGEL